MSDTFGAQLPWRTALALAAGALRMSRRTPPRRYWVHSFRNNESFGVKLGHSLRDPESQPLATHMHSGMTKDDAGSDSTRNSSGVASVNCVL